MWTFSALTFRAIELPFSTSSSRIRLTQRPKSPREQSFASSDFLDLDGGILNCIDSSLVSDSYLFLDARHQTTS